MSRRRKEARRRCAPLSRWLFQRLAGAITEVVGDTGFNGPEFPLDLRGDLAVIDVVFDRIEQPFETQAEIFRDLMLDTRARNPAGLHVVEYRGWTVAGPAPRGMRGPAWAARDELVRAGLADPADVARWDAAFAALDAATERPEVGLGVFAAVSRRPV